MLDKATAAARFAEATALSRSNQAAPKVLFFSSSSSSGSLSPLVGNQTVVTVVIYVLRDINSYVALMSISSTGTRQNAVCSRRFAAVLPIKPMVILFWGREAVR